MRVHVGVPWRAGDPHRERSLGYVLAHLQACGFNPGLHDSGHEPFNRAASRNQAVKDCDVAILHDADMILPLEQYQAMIEAALEGRVVVGFNEYRPLSRRTTEEVLVGRVDPFTASPVDRLVDFSVGGVIAMTPEAWWSVGGMNEEFTDWGGEDTAFANAAGALGPLVRIQGPGVHLWHPHASDPDNPHQRRNAELLSGLV